MNDFAINETTIKEINKEITGEGIVIKDSISSCFSSWDYYEDIESKISSVVRSIIKNHYFKDGNKRTAFAVFHLLSHYNGRVMPNKKWERIFMDIASNSYSVDKIKKLLFS